MRERWARRVALLSVVLGVGLWPAVLAAGRLPSAASAKGSAVGETALGDLAADAVRAAAKADVALLPAFWLKEVSLPSGEVAGDAARSVLAFPDDEIAVISLSGAHLAEALERGLALVPRPNKGFLQVAGLSMKFDRRQPPESRIQEIMVDTQRLNPAKTYKVAAPLPLAKGALGYFRAFNASPIAPTRITLADALARFLAAPGVLAIKGDRLRDLGAPPKPSPQV